VPLQSAITVSSDGVTISVLTKCVEWTTKSWMGKEVMYLEGGGREVRREAGMDRKRKGRQRARVGREGKGGGTEGGSKGGGV